MTLQEASTVFMLGIGGTGMRGLAKLLAGQGKKIIGSDQQYEVVKDWDDPTSLVGDELRGPSMIEKCDLIVYTDAATLDHPILVGAREIGILTMPYQKALGEFSRQFTTLAVTGTHGKSSTTAFLAHIFIEAGRDPNVLIGAPMPAWGGVGARAGKSNLFIVEADEYREHFLELTPAQAIITSIDFDHPDYFRSLEHVREAYDKFRQRVTGEVVESADVTGIPEPIPGEHMRRNAALAVKLAEFMGIERETAVAALQKFPGLGRRMEFLGSFAGMDIISDYGHHPAEIEVTLKAQIQKHKAQTLVIFEAHTLERLKVFFDDFARVLEQGNGVLLVPVFIPPGREYESTEARKKLAELEMALGKDVWNLKTWEDLPQALGNLSGQFDTAIAFTAGVLDAKLRKIVTATGQE